MRIASKAGLFAVALLPAVACGLGVSPGERLGEGEISYLLDFTGDRLDDRVTFDFEQPLDLSEAWGMSFEVRVKDMSDFRSFVLLLRTGSRRQPLGWYVYKSVSADEEEGGWLRIVQSRIPFFRLDSPDGFDRITCIRFTAYLQDGRRPGEFSFRRFRVLKDAPPPVNTDVHVRTAAVLDKVSAVPGKTGERRFAWTHVDTHGAPAPDWDALAARARRVGLTDLMPLLSWNGGAFFPSRFTGYQEKFVAEHGDQLAKCIAACHRHGVKCHVWKVNYRMRGSEALLDRMRREGRLQTIRQGTKAGNPLVESEWLCPSDPRNLKMESDAMFEIAGSGADGIHFDYIRYDGYNGCFCARCRERFETATGRKVVDWPTDVEKSTSRLAAEWDVFRKGNINALVEDVSRRVRAAYPRVEISAAVQSYNPANMPNGQDWPFWCRRKWLDFVCPMDYTNLSAFLKNVATLQKHVMDETGVPIYPGIGIHSGQSRLDALAAARQMVVLRELGFPGCSFFSFRATTYLEFDALAEGPMR